MYMYGGYHFLGMHAIWWIIWIFILFWIFAIPYNIPGQRSKKESHLDILEKRLASGEIDQEEYLQKKKILEE